MSEVKKHAKYSASSSERWLACPGSISLSEKAPPQRESAYATEGTKAHECLEMLLLHPEKLLANRAKLTKSHGPDMAEHAFAAAKKILALVPKGAELLVEVKSDLDFIEPDMGGTADVVIVEEFGTLHVIDYKYGQGVVVDPTENPQLISYALGIAHKYNFNFVDVKLSVLQPRAFTEDGQTFRSWTLDIDSLKSWMPPFLVAVVESKQTSPPFNAGDHCRWCPAKTICPEISTKALAVAQVEFTQDEVPHTPPVTSLNQERVSRALAAFPLIENWIEAVRAYALQTLQNGYEVPGWKLVEKRSIRKWTSPAIDEQAKKLFGKKAFTDPELKSPAQLEKISAKAKVFVEKNTTSVSSGVTLAPTSDKRNAVKNSAELDFGV